MFFLNEIKDNSILLIPYSIKDKVLDFFNESNKLINVKILTFNDLKKGLYFDYNNKSISYIMNNYQVSYEIASMYLKNMYYIDDAKNSDKINLLKKIKNELIAKDLLSFDKLFINLIIKYVSLGRKSW